MWGITRLCEAPGPVPAPQLGRGAANSSRDLINNCCGLHCRAAPAAAFRLSSQLCTGTIVFPSGGSAASAMEVAHITAHRGSVGVSASSLPYNEVLCRRLPRNALAFVAQNEAPLEIVYGTNATSEPKVRAAGPAASARG